MSNMSNRLPYLLAVRTVTAGHRMIMEGWEMFNEVVEAAGTGDLSGRSIMSSNGEGLRYG